MNIREVVAISLQSSHLETKEHESAIDRIGAFAHGSKLGRLLWRWKYALEDWRGNAVLEELLIKAERKFGIAEQKPDHKRLRLVCEQALVEWYFDKCQVCRGAAELVIGDKRVACWACKGSSVHRWSNRSRAQAIGADDFKIWEKRLADTIGILTSASSNVAGETRYQLKFEAGDLTESA